MNNDKVAIVSDALSILTIGHSTHSLERFCAFLKMFGVTALVDVRTSPYSRHSDHFNRENLKASLQDDGIAYVFLGKELGGRPSDGKCYHKGVADYEKMALQPLFQLGVERVIVGARKYKIAMMCSEQDPLDCHRCLLVARALAERGVAIQHILANGTTISQENIENQLLEMAGRSSDDLFASSKERLAIAYRARAMKVAFSEPQPDTYTAYP